MSHTNIENVQRSNFIGELTMLLGNIFFKLILKNVTNANLKKK